MLIERIPQLVANNQTVALVTVINAGGSTPAEIGKEMLVDASGIIGGTIGGGNLEHVSIKKAQECIRHNSSTTIHFDLKKDLGMECGGEVTIFIKVYSPPIQLVIVGAGHIGRVLYNTPNAGMSDRIDDRRCAAREHFPNAKQILVGDIGEECEKLSLSPSALVVIATRGHRCDEAALYHLIQKNPRYIGVIGSRNKVATMMASLKEKGIPQDLLDTVYAPIGLALGGGQPAEIAVSIISEILLVKNGGRLAHMKSLEG